MKWELEHASVAGEGGQHPCPIMSSVIDDVEKVSWIATIFILSVILGYPPMSIIVSRHLFALADEASSLRACFTRLANR
jgi:hypothetical protein